MRTVLVLLTVSLVSCMTSGASKAGSLSETFKRVAPAVVVVKTQQRQLASLVTGASKTTYVDVMGLGSGVLIKGKKGGLVFTAAHVVQAADRVQVEFQDGRKIDAKVTASWSMCDVALLTLDKTPLDIKPLVIGDSDKVEVGDNIFVVGAPHGLTHSLSVGYIGARRKSNQVLGAMAAVELFQTDAAINSGNSGGPMFNDKGEVIGIVSHILTRSGGFEGVGFAVTSNLAKYLLLETPSGWWGAEAQLISDELAKVFNLPQNAGLLIQRVAIPSPAHELGLIPGRLPARIGNQQLIVGGDVVLEVAGAKIQKDAEAFERIRTRIHEMKPTDRVEVKVLREGKIIDLSIARGTW